MTDTAPWICPGCSAEVATPYCPTCGEHEVRLDDLTLRGMFAQAFEAITNLDTRLGRTLGELVRRPGALTVVYRDGPRKPYIGPFALFLLTNLMFVAMELLPSSNIFSTPMDQHLHRQPWSPLAQRLVQRHLEEKGTTLEAYTPIFDQSVAANAQSLIIPMMVVPFALLLPMLFRRGRMPAAVHLAFSVHFHAFLLLLLGAALLIPAINQWFGGPGLESRLLDNGIAIASLLASAAYLFIAAGRVYGDGQVSRAVKATLLTVAAASVFLGYRFALLLITLYTT